MFIIINFQNKILHEKSCILIVFLIAGYFFLYFIIPFEMHFCNI